jgi:two-component system response regulator PilR (NtrC family)
MRQGAYDYICKPFDNEELKLLVQKALEKRSLWEENQQLWHSLSERSLSMVGQSPAMESVRALVRKVAVSRSTVLIVGESGTGKELVARAIHYASPRAAKPFLPVNCAALAEGVLESELFGHVKGAFTGAGADRRGPGLRRGRHGLPDDREMLCHPGSPPDLQEREAGGSTAVPSRPAGGATNKRLTRR